MLLFTITIDTARDNWVQQVRSASPEEALSVAIGMLPLEDGGAISQEDEDFLVAIATGKEPIRVEPERDKVNVWRWPQGSELASAMWCHIIQTAELG